MNTTDLLIKKYKAKISVLQKKQSTFEMQGKSGVCISLQGEIQAYNAVISDLEQQLKEIKEPEIGLTSEEIKHLKKYAKQELSGTIPFNPNTMKLTNQLTFEETLVKITNRDIEELTDGCQLDSRDVLKAMQEYRNL